MIVAATFLFTGCVSNWKMSTSNTLNRKSKFGIQIKTPSEWYGIRLRNSNYFTHHGIPIENIAITRIEWNDTLSNGHPIPQNILLHEIPELILADFYTQTNAYNLNIRNNKIIMIDSLPCAATFFEYTSNNGLDMQGYLSCIPLKNSITVLSYIAEKSIYFEKYQKDFKAMVKSIKIKDKKYQFLPGTSGFKTMVKSIEIKDKKSQVRLGVSPVLK